MSVINDNRNVAQRLNIPATISCVLYATLTIRVALFEWNCESFIAYIFAVLTYVALGLAVSSFVYTYNDRGYIVFAAGVMTAVFMRPVRSLVINLLYQKSLKGSILVFILDFVGIRGSNMQVKSNRWIFIALFIAVIVYLCIFDKRKASLIFILVLVTIVAQFVITHIAYYPSVYKLIPPETIINNSLVFLGMLTMSLSPIYAQFVMKPILIVVDAPDKSFE